MNYQWFSQTYSKYNSRRLPLFFIAGIFVDVLTLTRIDSMFALAQHGIFLLIVGTLLTFEVLNQARPLQIYKVFEKPWRYREEIIHFFLGSLLSAFAVFYFKSSSYFNFIVFFGAIIALMIANEMKFLRRYGLSIRFTYFSICVLSFFCYLVPMLWGRVGVLPFLTSLIISAAVLYVIFIFLNKRAPADESIKMTIALPTQSVFLIFFFLYFLQLIPPVPLSLKKIGIYHDVKKTSAGYVLSHEQPWWKFWHQGDRQFIAVDNDKIFCYFRIFSPTGFTDQVKVRWLYKMKNGWNSSDAIPVKIAGGRDHGFRGFTWKENFQPGKWQVRIETMDNREIGRLNFDVEMSSDPSQERRFLIDVD